MSLIFQSLQKLDEHQEAPPPGIGDPVPEKAGAASKSIRWLLPVAIGLVLSLALGTGAVYAVQYLKDRLPEKVRPSDRHERWNREEMREPVSPIEVNVSSIEESPEATMDRTAAPLPAENEKVQEPVPAPRYQFHPPVQENAATEIASVTPVEPKDTQFSKMSAADAAPSSPLPAPDANTAAGFEPKEVVTAEAPPVVDVEREAVEQARRAALAKSARIGRLVRQIEQALAGSAEAGDPGILLEKLARLKGENHPYVAKLRAYHNFQRGNMALAEADLYKVIAFHPDDLEAGINLALIEIHDQRYEKALDRLKMLRQTYPENERIADLIKRLR